jgi:GDP-L-fucose synthase
VVLDGQKVLVTGAAGLVGSNLIRRLVREGASVRGTIHQRRPADSDDRVEYVSCDLVLKDDCKRVIDDVRYVFHCAANSAGAAVTAATPMLHVTSNLTMNTHLLEAAYAADIEKFIWLGSTTAYPPCGNRPVKEEEILDSEPYSTYFCTGWEKRMMEILCQMYGEKLSEPMTTIVLRPTNIYGPNDEFDPARSRVTAALIKKVVDREDPIEVWGTGNDVRDHIFVEDVVDAMIIAVKNITRYATFNIGLGRGYSVRQLLKMILEIERYDNANVIYNASQPSMIPVRLIDTVRAESILGFRASTNLWDGLTKTIKWYRSSGRSRESVR